jgi:hypothetical protein
LHATGKKIGLRSLWRFRTETLRGRVYRKTSQRCGSFTRRKPFAPADAKRFGVAEGALEESCSNVHKKYPNQNISFVGDKLAYFAVIVFTRARVSR